VLGVIGLAIFATPQFALTRTATNAAFRVHKGRGLVHGFAFDLFALAVFGLLAMALAAALLMLATLANLAMTAGIASPFLSGVWIRAVAPALLYVVLLGLLFFVYRTFPNTGVSTRAAVTATLIVAVLWESARQVFAAYLTTFGTYGKLYGSFGVAAATLAWIYYSATIFVVGAGLTAVLTERYRGNAPEPVEVVTSEVKSRSRLPVYLLAAALGAIVALFAFQNAASITLRLFGWVLVDVPLSAVVLGAFAAGALATGLALSIARPSSK
jgi:YihY family inner membrane protein